ncbi:hypothetical protein [Herbidospora sp. RD11066]
MTEQRTLFDRECITRGWGRTSAFLEAFAQTAQLLREEVTLTERQFRRWRGDHPPNPRPRAWRVLHAMFGVSPLDLGFPGPAPASTPPTLGRRAFLADAIGTAAIASLASGDSVGTAHLTELREGLFSLYALDDAYGGGDVRSLALRHFRRVRRVINTGQYSEAIGRQLQLLLGEAAEHCAWLHYDADIQDEARRYWGEALTTATVLRDTNLEIVAFAGLSMQAIHEDRPREGYNLAQAARQRAEALQSPILISLIAAREARALAKMRDDSGARRELAHAMRTVDRTNNGQPTPAWAAFHGPAELEYAQGLIYVDGGRHNAAIPFLRASLQHQQRKYTRNFALYRLTLARSLASAGEIDEAAAEAVQAVPELAEVESARVLRRLIEVRDLVAAAKTTSATHCLEAISEYTNGRS